MSDEWWKLSDGNWVMIFCCPNRPLDIQMLRNHIFRNLDVSPHAHHMIVVSGLHLYVSSSHSFRNTDADMTHFLQVRRLRRKEKLLSRFGCIFLLPRVRVDSTRWGVCEGGLNGGLRVDSHTPHRVESTRGRKNMNRNTI